LTEEKKKMIKVTDREYSKVEKLIKQFIEEHPEEKQQNIKQFKAWLEVNLMVQIIQEK
jgi:tRNA 2-selenouridine synthase SelU